MRSTVPSPFFVGIIVSGLFCVSSFSSQAQPAVSGQTTQSQAVATSWPAKKTWTGTQTAPTKQDPRPTQTSTGAGAGTAISQIKLDKFDLQSSAIIKEGGSVLSDPHYVSANFWFPVQVPSTVLTGLVANHVYPDPYTGMNNMLIPDASDSFNHQYHLEQYSYLPNDPNPWKKPYWYRTQFMVAAGDKGRHFQLIFKGINYRAEVWLNGQRLADSSQMAGMFAEHSLDADKAIRPGGKNALAVKIYPLDEPGLPAHPQLDALGDFYDNGGPTGDIGKNVTMLSSVGWDWIPEVRDRNIGIWQPVYLRVSGQVLIGRPQLITELPALPDTGVAKISLHLQLYNKSERQQKGKLWVTISPENFSGIPAVSFSREETVGAMGSETVDLTADNTKELLIRRPHLWWPNGYGHPDLYRIRLRYMIDGQPDGQPSEDTSFVFGIRTVSSQTVEVNGWVRRDFYVNGKRVHLVGGAWVPDMMLNRDSLRYDYELRLCRNANVNLVRIWGGGLGETDDFYELADRYGLLVWQDFWITGDTNGGFKGSEDWPLESSVFIDNVVNTIYRIRNHPSLLVWTGGNEGHAREELYNAMRDNTAKLDGTRPFIPCSSGFAKAPAGWKGSWPDDKPAGVYSGGPYSWQDDARYYELVNAGKDWVFKDETGLPSQPPYNTLMKIIPNLVPDSKLPYPLNNTWGYHDACSGNGKYDLYYEAMADRYGEAAGMKDFSDKMQLLNAGGYRSIFEAAGHKLNETGGVMLWKLNAAFPSVIWQIYDWYLEPNAGYYFMQGACEPVHIQLNLDDSSVVAINRTYHPKPGLRYEAEAVDLAGTSLYKKEGGVNLDTTDVKPILSLRDLLRQTKGISFVSLRLKDANGAVVSRNIYWMSPGHDFRSLHQLSSTSVRVKVLRTVKTLQNREWTVRFSNVSEKLAFFINPQVIKGDREEILPSYWSGNYFSLSPGESVTVTVSCPEAVLGGEGAAGSKPSLRLKTEGWNVGEQWTGLSGE
ncbi:MAG: glycoside hydrolase family 2 TIM barrel-domain containing protein [Puia sp.]|nr:glycoside hydrolase family 2 TIM barrel-domain containing protein [Puia sp.]